MLHFILLILKIIGVLLLLCLGLILLILLTVLLVPVKYRVTAEHGEEFHLDGRASWLLHLINARFTHIEGVLHIRVRVLWFQLYDNLQPKQRKKKARKIKRKVKRDATRKAKKKTKKLNSKTLTDNKKEVKQTGTDTGKGEVKQDLQNVHLSELKPESKVPANEKNLNQEEADYQEDDKKSFLRRLADKIKNVKQKVLSFFRRLKEKVKKWFEAAVNLRHKISLISDFLHDSYNREGFQVTYNSLKKLLKHILPKKLKSRIVFGTGDPCTTGQALGFMGILYSFYGDKIVIIPDFENKIFEGNHYARGRIRLITLLIIVIKLIRDRRFKNLKKNFQLLKEAL
jgi:hypothetical protein